MTRAITRMSVPFLLLLLADGPIQADGTPQITGGLLLEQCSQPEWNSPGGRIPKALLAHGFCYGFLQGVYSTLQGAVPQATCITGVTGEQQKLTYLKWMRDKPIWLSDPPAVAVSKAFVAEGLCTFSQTPEVRP